MQASASLWDKRWHDRENLQPYSLNSRLLSAYGEDLIHQQDLRLQVGRDRHVLDCR